MKLGYLTIFCMFICTPYLFAQDYLPSNIYQLDQRFAHHALIVEKSTHSLYLYEFNNAETPKLLKKYQIATGKKRGDKLIQGDLRTPEGVYHFQHFNSSEFLLKKYGETGKIYGAGAFTLNYPNEIDSRNKKTGGGIWLHSTDDDARVDKGLDSRGCVVAVDADLKEISKYIDLTNTPTIIVQDLHYLNKKTWKKNKLELVNFVNDWVASWQSKDINKYMSFYSKPRFFHNTKGGFQAYRTYKNYIFRKKDTPQIELRNISILSHDDYTVVTFEQDYKSEFINDVGKKTLYLQQNRFYEWKIVAELFHKIERKEDIAFIPSMRFFTPENNKVSKNDNL